MLLRGAGGFPDCLWGHAAILSCKAFQLCTHIFSISQSLPSPQIHISIKLHLNYPLVGGGPRLF